MGQVFNKKYKGNASEERSNKQIEGDQKRQRSINARVIKLLLLGAGESGKSTLFKQMRRLYGVGFDERELLIYKPGIYRNILQSCTELFIQAEKLDPKRFPRPKISAEARSAGVAISRAYEGLNNPKYELKVDMLKPLQTLWKDPGIQKTYEYSSAFQMIDSIEYFMEELPRICRKGYIPNYQDCLRCRIRTTGVVEFEFKVESNKFTMIDVGGQRSERKKWLHCFQDVTAVIFVAAVSEYDQVLFEDDETNRLIEAVGLFKQIVNYECFKDKTSMILFLNKSDLLLKKVCDKRPLSLCVEDYKGPNTYAAACELFKDMFSAQVTNALTQKLYTHVTCATDTDQIRTVFLSVKDILLQQSLMNSGLIE